MEKSSSDIIIKRYKSESGYTQVHLTSFDSDDSSLVIPAGYHINGLIFESDPNNQSLVLSVIPGNINIKAGFPGKAWLERDVKISKGDSTVIKLFLKDEIDGNN